ncbi:MAG: alpha/beta hydrolase [Gammaproteobacteria bacterium]|nr:alpha/beta hydrolase [Gammaproteobacteria bacterium]
MTQRVVLLHGLWMPGAAMQWFAAQLKAAGFAPSTFSYPSVAGGPEAAVPRLVQRLREVDAAHVVAHSLGGLIALQALCAEPDVPVARVVCLGSPLRGSGAASGVLTQFPAASLMLGRSAALLQQGFGCWQGRVEVGAIAGRVPRGLGALFAGFSGEHDGTVAVEETRLPGLADHVVVEASHSGLLFSAEAAQYAIAFLRHGRFSTEPPHGKAPGRQVDAGSDGSIE